ncbi:MAG TPA: hypothetical protein VID71_06195 [Steroidobacteraceae bacterium]|jgi:hypothetical protein
MMSPLRYVLAWVALWALYLGLAGSVSDSELLTGAIVAGACTGWAVLLRHCSPHRFVASRAHFAPWSRSLRQLFPQAFATGAVLAAALLRTRPTQPLARVAARSEGRFFGALQSLHSGLVGDYVVWMLLGLAALVLTLQRAG